MKSFKFRRGLVAALLLVAPLLHAATPVPTVDKGDVAWMLTSTLLVLLMTVPGLALFYGGLVRCRGWRCSTAAWCGRRTCCRC